MSRIKASNTKPENYLKRIIKELKIPFKENVKALPGKPDLYIPSLNLIIQVHGCFWHGHSGCRDFIIPKTNTEFWQKKISSNVNRDKKNVYELSKLNLNILVLWECEIKNGFFFEKLINVLNLLISTKKFNLLNQDSLISI